MTVKRTAAETRAHIAALEAEIKMLREREGLDAYAAEMHETYLAFVPARDVYVGQRKPDARTLFENALADVEAEHWDEHQIKAVFDLCERCGVRPRSRAPQDIEEAAESILLKYPR